jgi:hypothetical protein
VQRARGSHRTLDASGAGPADPWQGTRRTLESTYAPRFPRRSDPPGAEVTDESRSRTRRARRGGDRRLETAVSKPLRGERIQLRFVRTPLAGQGSLDEWPNPGDRTRRFARRTPLTGKELLRARRAEASESNRGLAWMVRAPPRGGERGTSRCRWDVASARNAFVACRLREKGVEPPGVRSCSQEQKGSSSVGQRDRGLRRR